MLSAMNLHINSLCKSATNTHMLPRQALTMKMLLIMANPDLV